MKTLGEVIDVCKNGGKPDLDDARFAICALDALLTFESTALMRLAQREDEGKSPGIMFSAGRNWETHFNRVKKAMNKPPLEWLGPNSHPDDPAVQERRKTSQKIWDAAMAKAKEKEGDDAGSN